MIWRPHKRKLPKPVCPSPSRSVLPLAVEANYRSRSTSIGDRLPPLRENKLRQRQVAWIGDLEIEIIIENESDLATESLDCRNFISYGNIFCVNSAIRLLNQLPLKNLRRLHRVQLMSVHRLGDHEIGICAF